MNTLRGIWLTIALLIGLMPCVAAEAFSENDGGILSGIYLAAGPQWIEYAESEGDTSITSHAKSSNFVTTVEAIKRWDRVFCSLRGVFPVHAGDARETWDRSGRVFQSNDLEFGWLTIDGSIGYPFRTWLNPYAGFRWAENKQERSDFTVTGMQVGTVSVEKVQYWAVILGLRGSDTFASHWRWHWCLEYFYPIDQETTNSALPSFKASDSNGFSIEARAGLDYSVAEHVSFGFVCLAGKAHWDGSGWQQYGAKSVKWPENDTQYFGVHLQMSWTF